MVRKVTDQGAVEAALDEFDRIGRTAGTTACRSKVGHLGSVAVVPLFDEMHVGCGRIVAVYT